MLLPRLDVMDSNYTTLYRIAEDVMFHVHVPRTSAAETVGRHLDSSFIILPDYNVVVDRRLSSLEGNGAHLQLLPAPHTLIAPTPSITAAPGTERQESGQVVRSVSTHADSFVHDPEVPP